MRVRKTITVASAVAAVAVACSGCSSEPITSADIWRAANASSALEADMPGDLEQMTDRALLVVRGSIARISEGPALVDELPEGTVETPSRVLTLSVSEVVSGEVDGDVKVHFQLLQEELPITDELPSEEYLWFLEPAGIEDFWMTASTLGVIGTLGGELTTVRNPTEDFLDEDLDDVAEVAEVVERLTSPAE